MQRIRPGGSRLRVGIGSTLTAASLLCASIFGLAAPGPAAAACGSFQALVNAAPSGGTITVPACTYHEAVTIAKPLTIHASGVVVDGDNTRGTGIAVTASDVSIDGLTVTHVKAGDHRGAVWTTGVSRFTFRNGVARDSSPICISINGGSGHQVLDSELTGCAQEGYFMNAVSDTTFARDNIHNNNMALAYDWGIEAGGGKTMASSRVTFDSNEVANNRGPGLWFDVGDSAMTARNNRIHGNDREGIFFEISTGASFTGNAIWSNGFGYVAWGYGAGITISSSNNADVSGNTVAWNARGISVISQDRNSPPHKNNYVHDNIIIGATGDRLAGWYDDHGGTLFSSANGNHGSGDRYWSSVAEPTSSRYEWNGGRSTLSAYNSTPGEEGATYLSSAERDAALGAAGIPAQDGSPLPGPPPPAAPRFSFHSGSLGSSTVPATISWAKTTGATAYQAQLKRDSGLWTTVPLASAKSNSASVTLTLGHSYRARVRVKYSFGSWSAWSYGATVKPSRSEETSGAIDYAGTWRRGSSAGSSGGYIERATKSTASATFTFTGWAVAFVAPTGPTLGSFRVYVDGVYRGTYSLYSSSFTARGLKWRTSWSASALHTIQIKVVGTAGHPLVAVDAFLVLR